MDLHDFADVAENYDHYVQTLVGEADGVVDFHLELAREHGAGGIVDIACGTGVTLIPLAQAGYRVMGLDLSAAMIEVLQRKLDAPPPEQRSRASGMVANMTDFALPERVSLAMIPRSGFLHLLTPEDQERALRCIHRELLPGGVLTFNSVDPNLAYIAQNLKHKQPAAFQRAQYTNHRGNREVLWNRVAFDPMQQRIEAEWIFEEYNAAGELIERRVRPLRMRYSFEPELSHLLRLCGFRVLAQYGSYTREPRQSGSAIIWIVQKEE